MLLQKYLNTIKEINPQKIYVENVRSLFKVPRTVAKLMCEMAVVDKLFIKKIGILCPNCKSIIGVYDKSQEIPSEITCSICELDEHESFHFHSSELEKIEFYQLNKENENI